MSQITHGVRAILSHPMMYQAFQYFMGAKSAYRHIVADYIRPTPGMRILDLGCGPAEILAYLPHDITYVGYDMSAAYIDSATARFGTRGEFRCRLLEQAEANGLEKFDLVMGIGVLHHLDDAQSAAFMALAQSALKPNGRVLTRDPCYAAGQNPLARFLIARDRGQHVRDATAYERLGRAAFSQVTGCLTHQAWIPYTHWTMECR